MTPESALTLIREEWEGPPALADVPTVLLCASRTMLAKRRWRATAEDGREFGFALAQPLRHGTTFLVDGSGRYVLDQHAEEVLSIPLPEAMEAAGLAWQIGNLHLQLEVTADAIQVVDDPAARKFLEREGIAFQPLLAVFLPLSAATGHHHHHE